MLDACKRSRDLVVREARRRRRDHGEQAQGPSYSVASAANRLEMGRVVFDVVLCLGRSLKSARMSVVRLCSWFQEGTFHLERDEEGTTE